MDNIIINAAKVQSALGGANLLNDSDLGAREVPSRIHGYFSSCKNIYLSAYFNV